jgi:hypothetical protein
MVKARELLIMASGGVSLGLAAVVLDTSVSVPSDGQQYSQPTTVSLVGEQAQLEAEFHAKLDELRRLETEASSPAQQWAEGVLASGQPLTMREMSTLSQIVNVSLGGVSGYPGYSGSNYASGAPSVAAVTGLQNGLPRRTVLDQPSASRAWLEREQRTSTQAYGPATVDFSDSTINNAGAIDVRSGQYYAPAGAGYVNPQNGTYYAPSGPNGVVDTRTGAFIPTVR